MAAISPDGKYHYLLSYSLNGNQGYGHMTVSTSVPALATNGVISGFAEHVARENGVTARQIVFCSVCLLAAPRE